MILGVDQRTQVWLTLIVLQLVIPLCTDEGVNRSNLESYGADTVEDNGPDDMDNGMSQ